MESLVRKIDKSVIEINNNYKKQNSSCILKLEVKNKNSRGEQ